MAIFDRLDRMASAAVDRINGVAATITPRLTTANGRGKADPDRDVMEVVGVLHTDTSYHNIETGSRDRKGNSFSSLVTGPRIEFSVDIARYPEAADVRQGDKLVTDAADRYQVTQVEPDGMTRVVFVLTK